MSIDDVLLKVALTVTASMAVPFGSTTLKIAPPTLEEDLDQAALEEVEEEVVSAAEVGTTKVTGHQEAGIQEVDHMVEGGMADNSNHTADKVDHTVADKDHTVADKVDRMVANRVDRTAVNKAAPDMVSSHTKGNKEATRNRLMTCFYARTRCES